MQNANSVDRDPNCGAASRSTENQETIHRQAGKGPQYELKDLSFLMNHGPKQMEDSKRELIQVLMMHGQNCARPVLVGHSPDGPIVLD